MLGDGGILVDGDDGGVGDIFCSGDELGDML